MGMGSGWGWMCTHSVWHGSIIDIRGKGGGGGHVCGSTPWMALVLGFVVPCLIWNTSLLQRLGIKLSPRPTHVLLAPRYPPFPKPIFPSSSQKIYETRTTTSCARTPPYERKKRQSPLLPCTPRENHRKRQMVGGTKKSTRQTIHQPDPTVQLPARYSACPVSNSTAPNRNGKENLVSIVIFVVVTTTAQHRPSAPSRETQPAIKQRLTSPHPREVSCPDSGGPPSSVTPWSQRQPSPVHRAA